jgi:hypothetical protein
MKVYEIISEEGPGIGMLTKAAGWALNKLGGGALTKILGKGEFIDQEAHAVAALAKEKGVNVTTALSMRQAQILDSIKQGIKHLNPKISPAELEKQAHEKLLAQNPHLNDPGVLNKIASKAGTQSGVNAIKTVGEKLTVANEVVSRMFQVWGLYQLYQPWADYKEQIELGQKKLESGEWDQATYQAWVNRQAVFLLANEAKLLTVATMVKLFSSGAVKSLGELSPSLGNLLSKGGPALALTYFNSPESREALAAGILNILGPNVTDAIGRAISPATENFKNFRFIGSNAETPTAKPTAGRQGATSQGTTTGTTAQQDIGSTSNTQPASGTNAPSVKSEWPGGAPGTPGSPWQDTGNGEFINKETGNVKFMPRGSKLD